jgi:hypothetical protein
MAWVSSATAIKQNSNWLRVWTMPGVPVVTICRACAPLTTPLVPDVLQRCRNVNLLGALGHPVEHHVDEDIGPGPADAVAVEGERIVEGKAKRSRRTMGKERVVSRAGEGETCSG